MKTTITSQVVAQGSYGLTKINPRNGVRIGNLIKVWHVHSVGEITGTPGKRRIGTFLTRQEARDTAYQAKNT